MNIPRLLILGTTKLGFTEESVMKMTPRKFFKIFEEFQFMTGIKKEAPSIDDLA